jgi:hypothetical protein
MNVVAPERVRHDSTTVVEPRPVLAPQAEAPAAPPSEAAGGVHANRWFLILGTPFVLGAAFFGLAIGFDVEWPMTPAFLFGPLAMIAGYIYLMLSGDTNSESA